MLRRFILHITARAYHVWNTRSEIRSDVTAKTPPPYWGAIFIQFAGVELQRMFVRMAKHAPIPLRGRRFPAKMFVDSRSATTAWERVSGRGLIVLGSLESLLLWPGL